MDAKPIRDAHKREPFVPFTLRTAAGERYAIDRPERM